MKNLSKIVFIILIVALGFYYRNTIQNIWLQAFNSYFPCKQPIMYSLGTFDTRFGLTRAGFLSAIKDAEAIWEKPVGKELFRYDPKGSLKVNLTYDSRQESTSQLKKMGIVVENNKASYDSLKSKYDNLSANYNANKKAFESRVSAFEARQSAYEAEVAAVNSKGGADRETFNRLNTEKEYLRGESLALQNLQSNLNLQVAEVNALAKALNQLATSLNINVGKYNTIGNSLGGEFEEGTYTVDVNGRTIDIYQFDNRAKLVRVLAHELGHALGLEHVEDPKAIMYRLNNGVNEKLTATDLAQVKTLCGIK